MKLIDKAALVAEIERQRKIYMYDVDNKHSFGRMTECNDLLVFLDTLEVKDFEVTWEDVAWIVNKAILLCKVESILTAEDICKEVLKQFKAQKGE